MLRFQMAADHRRKRLNGASIAGCSSWEQSRIKKKKLVSPKSYMNLKSHISLEWDGRQQQVVAKGEQVGISKRDLRPFVDSVPRSRNVLADVVTVPRDIFELENLEDVLSYKGWQTHLSENERKFLARFLPRGMEVEEVVQALLDGDNFHFGNPFLNWGASVCSGSSHPDAIIMEEQHLRDDKRAYYSEIQKYHNDMIEYLQKLKKMWEGSKDPEKEVLHKIWRSRGEGEKRMSLHATEYRFRDLEENALATSESCSFAAEEKAWSSDNQNSPVMNGGKLKKRSYDKGSMKGKTKNPMVPSYDARPRKGDKLQKHNIHHSDGAKYMSYLKISKKQHQLLTNMKQSGKGIHSKSLNHVLGNIDNLHVQPFEDFVKEEQNKLRQHWLQVAKEDIPAAYGNWREMQLQKREIIKSLEHDMKDRPNSPIEDEDNENHDNMLLDQEDEDHKNHDNLLLDQEDQESDDQGFSEEDEGKENHDLLFLKQNDQGAKESESNVEDEEEESQETMLQDEDENDQGTRNEESDVEYDKDSASDSLDHHSPQHISPNGAGDDDVNPIEMDSENNNDVVGSDDLNPIEMDSENENVTSKSSDASPNISDYSGNANTGDASIMQRVPISSGGDVWPTVGVPRSYYDSSTSHDEYASAGGLSLPHQVNEEQRTQLIDLESDVPEEDTRKDLLNGQSDGSFSSYPSHDRSGLLQSLFKGQGMSTYHHAQKHPGLDFQSSNNVLMEDGRFTGQLQSSLPLDHGHKRHSEDYMHQNISEDIYSGGGGYLIPNRGHVPPVNVPSWPVNPVRMSAPLPSHLSNDGLLPQNWFTNEHQVRPGWSGADCASAPSQNMASNADQSLFSILPQCNQLSPFSSVGSTEQFMLPRNYGMGSGVPPRSGGTLPQAAHPLDYLSGRETAGSLMPDDMAWMNLPHNSALHDAMGKPFLRSWNQ